MQIQAERSGKAWRTTQGWGSDPAAEAADSQRSGYRYGQYGGYYGSPYENGEKSTYYRRYYRRRQGPVRVGLFGFPLLRLILIIVILRFVLGVVFSLLYALAGQNHYYYRNDIQTEQVEYRMPDGAEPEADYLVL